MSLAEKTGSRIRTVTIRTTDDEPALVYSVQIPTAHRWLELGLSVIDPDKTRYETINPETRKREFADEDGYSLARQKAGDLRAAVRVAACLFSGGEEFPTDAGNTDRSRGEWVLANMSPDIVATIGGYLARAHRGEAARINVRADSFRGEDDRGVVAQSHNGSL